MAYQASRLWTPLTRPDQLKRTDSGHYIPEYVVEPRTEASCKDFTKKLHAKYLIRLMLEAQM